MEPIEPCQALRVMPPPCSSFSSFFVATSHLQSRWPGTGRSTLCICIAPMLPCEGFPCSSVGKEPTCNAGNPGLTPGFGRSPGEGNGSPLQYWRIPWTRGWQATVRGVARVRHDLATKPPPPPPALIFMFTASFGKLTYLFAAPHLCLNELL